MPATAIEKVKVIAPVEHKFFFLGAPLVDLNVIEEQVPRHVSSIQSMAPRVESGSPEVHSEGLRLVKVGYSGVSEVRVAHSVAIDGPADVLGGPLKLIDVPVVMRVEAMGVIV